MSDLPYEIVLPEGTTMVDFMAAITAKLEGTTMRRSDLRLLAGTELILEERGDWARIVTLRPGDRFAGILVI